LNSRPPPYQGGALPLSYSSAGSVTRGRRGIPLAVRGTQAAGLAGGGLTWGGAGHFCVAMDKETEGKPSARPAVTARAAAEQAARRAREAAALRANLRRRKEQARARELPADDEVPR